MWCPNHIPWIFMSLKTLSMHKGSPWVVHSFNSFQPPHSCLISTKVNAEDWLHCWVRPERYYVALKAIDEYILSWLVDGLQVFVVGWLFCVSSHDWYIGVPAILYHCGLFRILCMCFLHQTLGVLVGQFGGKHIGHSPRKPLRIWWVDIRWPMSRATVTTPFSQCWVQYSHSHLMCLWVFSWLIDWWLRLIDRHQFTPITIYVYNYIDFVELLMIYFENIVASNMFFCSKVLVQD